MPQTPNARVSFGAILNAIRDQLVADTVAVSSAMVVFGTPQNHPTLAGTNDILLIANAGKHEGRDGGAQQLMMTRVVDIWIRDQSIADTGQAFEDWIVGTFVAADQIIDSVGNDEFWPTDPQGNLLLIQSAKLVGDKPPDYKIKGSVYGQYVCSIECTYFPAIDPGKNP